MSRADWIEVALIALLIAGSWLLHPLLPASGGLPNRTKQAYRLC